MNKVILYEKLFELVRDNTLEKVVVELVSLAEAKEAYFQSRNTFSDDKEARAWHRAVVALDKALMNIDI